MFVEKYFNKKEKNLILRHTELLMENMSKFSKNKIKKTLKELPNHLLNKMIIIKHLQEKPNGKQKVNNLEP
jgi:hypothetical protein